jgi:hypothetical protein
MLEWSCRRRRELRELARLLATPRSYARAFLVGLAIVHHLGLPHTHDSGGHRSRVEAVERGGWLQAQGYHSLVEDHLCWKGGPTDVRTCRGHVYHVTAPAWRTSSSRGIRGRCLGMKRRISEGAQAKPVIEG